MSRVGEKSGEYQVGEGIAPGLGARIGAVADSLGSRRAVAAKMRISVSALQRYVTETNMPPFDFCAQLCALAGARMEWLAFNKGPMSPPDAYVTPAPRSQSVIREPAGMETGMHDAAVRITVEVLGKFGLRDKLSLQQSSELVRIVYNDLARGAAEDAAIASLDRILAINRKS